MALYEWIIIIIIITGSNNTLAQLGMLILQATNHTCQRDV